MAGFECPQFSCPNAGRLAEPKALIGGNNRPFSIPALVGLGSPFAVNHGPVGQEPQLDRQLLPTLLVRSTGLKFASRDNG